MQFRLTMILLKGYIYLLTYIVTDNLWSYMSRFRPFTYISHAAAMEHDTGSSEHPEVKERLLALEDRLQNSLLTPMMTKVETVKAERHWLLTCHDERYLYRFEEAALAGRTSIDHSDNQICFESYEAACLSASAGPTGIDLLENGEADRVFCGVRPPGHHAEKASALGFCFFNNCGIAARYWQQAHGRKKIVIIDWDAHHGNGIQSAFEHDPTVFYISIHEHPTFSFPGTGWAEENGLGEGKGTTLNIPLSPGADDAMVLKVLNEKVGPALEAFQPDAMIVAAGFDGHLLDDMSGLAYTTTLYGQLGVFMNVWAQQYCNAKILSILEGGYHIEAMAASAEAYIAGIAAKPPK